MFDWIKEFFGFSTDSDDDVLMEYYDDFKEIMPQSERDDLLVEMGLDPNDLDNYDC